MDGNTKKIGRRIAGALLTMLLPLLFTISLRAQTVNLGGTGALGKFINPTSVTTNTGSQVCGYNEIRIDLAQGKVFAIPNRTTSNIVCTDRSAVDITNVTDATTGQTPFSIPPTGPITNGVLEVTDFTLQRAFGPSVLIDGIFGYTSNLTHLTFVSNADNTPVWIRATGDVTIQSGAVLNVEGRAGAGVVSTFLRGAGGNGGPGGFRGGDGGNGGISPSTGSQGFGPGGSAGAAINANAISQALFLTTNKTIVGTAIPAGNDLLTMLRGGSGGGGGGGRTAGAGAGGGGGGGAILVASNGTITVSGNVAAVGGDGSRDPCCTTPAGAGGSGGVVRLVANIIAGGGTITAAGGGAPCGFAPCPAVGQNGIVRLEAFTISFSGTFGGNVAAASAPGQIFLPTSTTTSAFLKVSKITNSANTAEFRDATNTGVPDVLTRQDIAGRAGLISAVDVTMPDLDLNPVAAVDVDFTVGPCTGPNAFPAGKHITLVVTPLDSAQGLAKIYSTDPASPNFTSGSTAIDCAATPHARVVIPGTAGPDAVLGTADDLRLPLGFSSFSAFTVVNIDTGGALARMFPKMYEGEEIESVRIEANARGTEYVLIAKSGKEFAYQPGR